MPGLLNYEEAKLPVKSCANFDTSNSLPTNSQGKEEVNLPEQSCKVAPDVADNNQSVPRKGLGSRVYKPQPPRTEAETERMASAWQAAAAEGAKAYEEGQVRRMRDEHLYRRYEGNKAGPPLRFYGPGPDGRVNKNDPPIGTLHFARWRHELADTDDPDGAPYYHEDPRLKNNDGVHVRPTYVTNGHQAIREVNYYRWERVPAYSLEGVKVFPGPGATRANHDEYLLNELDFNRVDKHEPAFGFALSNRQNERPHTIYPAGYKLLKALSKKNGHAEWMDGQCLGPDPKNPNGLTKHLGWIPGRLRTPKAGLGADPYDAIWNDIFHGNLQTKPTKKFVIPKDTWKEDESKVMILTSSKNLSHKLEVVSLSFLLNTLPPLEPDTINARNAWLSSKAGSRRVKLIEVKEEKVALVIEKPLSDPAHVVKEDQKGNSLEDITNGIESLDIVKEEDNNDDEDDDAPSPYVNFRSRFLGVSVDRA